MKQVLVSLKWELLHAFRDKHTIIYTILVPLLLYPIMFFCLVQITEITESYSPQMVSICIIGEGPLADALARDSSVIVYPPVELPELSDSLAIIEFLEFHGLDAALTVNDLEARIIYLSTRNQSVFAMETVLRILEDLKEDSLFSLSQIMGKSWVSVFQIDTIDLATPQEAGSMILSLIIPLTIVVMATMGAYYPAIDVTVGERERRTVETTLSTPRTTLELALSKLLVVFLSSSLALVLNLSSMILAVRVIIPPEQGRFLFSLSPSSIIIIVIAGMEFILLVSSVLILFAFRARSFREAQSTAGIVYMLGILPAMVAVVPGISINHILALVPSVNVALIVKAAIRGVLDPSVFLTYSAGMMTLACFSIIACVRSLRKPELWFEPATGGSIKRRILGYLRREM
jgi:sodium transport system permease protein